jgi:ankyrin repeat protein
MEYNDLENQVGGANIRRALPLVTRPFTSYDRQLLDAITPGNVNEVDRLLNLGANANAVSENTERTPLYKAVVINDLPIVRRLLQGGANPNLKIRLMSSPFKLAFGVLPNEPCNFELINEMITTGHIIFNEYNEIEAASFLIDALDKNCLTTIRLLLRSGLNPNFLVNPYIKIRRFNCSREAATILLDNGLNITLYESFATDDERLIIFRNVLIDRLNNVNLIFTFVYKDRYRLKTFQTEQLLLTYAVLNDNIELVNILLAKGADPNITMDYTSNIGVLDLIDSQLYRDRSDRPNRIEILRKIIAAGAINNPINQIRHPDRPDEIITKYIEDPNGFLTLNPLFLSLSPQLLTSVSDFIIPEEFTLVNFNILKTKVECPICRINIKKVILNCNHAFCEICSNSLKNCSICNNPITNKLKIYKKYLFNNQ